MMNWNQGKKWENEKNKKKKGKDELSVTLPWNAMIFVGHVESQKS